jgi:hypothetical protein
MEAPSPRYIISRAAFLIALLIVCLIGLKHFKKYQRKNVIFSGLQSITSDSSFFRQFSAEDAHKSLIRAIGLIAEANTLGVEPDDSINRGMGIEEKIFASDTDRDEPPVREKIIRNCLRSNYENFLKLGYTADFQTLTTLKQGELPAIPSGPQSGKKPEIANLIPPEISPGMEKVIANLEMRPPQTEARKPTDIELASAKKLANELASARIIENDVRDRILKGLTPPAAAPESPGRADPARSAH